MIGDCAIVLDIVITIEKISHFVIVTFNQNCLYKVCN